MYSFAATGAISVVIAWFILPEVTRRTPGEIDEMYVQQVLIRNFPNWIEFRYICLC
jgi:hypothetical protein